MGEAAENIERVVYTALPTGLNFHNSDGKIRGIVGPIGSGKTSMAAWEICYYLPWFLYNQYNIPHTKWAVVRNTYRELIDTTQATIFEWFSFGEYFGKREMYSLEYPDGPKLDILFRACDQKKHTRQFKSLEITGYWIDESIEVGTEAKLMLRGRIGRYPRAKCSQCGEFMEAISGRDTNDDQTSRYICPACRFEFEAAIKYGIETTNPPDVEHPTYSEFGWTTPPPGPIPKGEPKKGYVGFWQPPRENEKNLPLNYYEDLMEDYRDQRDWAEMYVEGKPGIVTRGKRVYHRFKRDIHVAKGPLVWSGGRLFRGWDDSGNTPACIVISNPSAGRIHILREFCSDRQNIADFAQHVVNKCNYLYPDAEWVDYDDPAGWNKFAKREGGFTSNAQIIQEATGIEMKASEQNFEARLNAVESQLAIIDGILVDPGCIRLINGFLGGYCYPEIGVTGEYKDKPEKNRFSHIHDALQYVLVKLLKVSKTRKLKRRRPRRRNAMAV